MSNINLGFGESGPIDPPEVDEPEIDLAALFTFKASARAVELANQAATEIDGHIDEAYRTAFALVCELRACQIEDNR